MKFIVSFIALFFSGLVLAAGDHSEFIFDGAKYEVEGTANWIDPTLADSADIRLRYAVKRNGKPLWGKSDFGGTADFCLAMPEEKPAMPSKFFEPLVLDGKTRGWLVKGLGVCGNTTSYRYQVILPAKESYAVAEFLSKTDAPRIISGANGSANIWYLSQVWGKAGTAWSFYVPRKIHIQITPLGQPKVLSVAMGTDMSNWPDWGASWNYKKFPPLFVAALWDRDPALMKLAVDQFYKTDKESLDWYKTVGAPQSKADADAALKAFSIMSDYLKTFRNPD